MVMRRMTQRFWKIDDELRSARRIRPFTSWDGDHVDCQLLHWVPRSFLLTLAIRAPTSCEAGNSTS